MNCQTTDQIIRLFKKMYNYELSDYSANCQKCINMNYQTIY